MIPKRLGDYRLCMNFWAFRPRRAVRKAVHVAAWIEKEGNDLLERCELIDISANGARLRIVDIYNLPTNLTLHLARGSQTFSNVRLSGSAITTSASSSWGGCFPTSTRRCRHPSDTRKRITVWKYPGQDADGGASFDSRWAFRLTIIHKTGKPTAVSYLPVRDNSQPITLSCGPRRLG